jgi:hypothetical protein
MSLGEEFMDRVELLSAAAEIGISDRLVAAEGTRC